MTIFARKWKTYCSSGQMSENPTINLDAPRNLCTKITGFFPLRWNSHFFMRAAASKMRASNWYFVNFALHPNPSPNPPIPHGEKSKGVRPGDSSSSTEVQTCSNKLLFLMMTDIITSQITDLSCWITLYIRTALFRIITQRLVVISYRRFGSTYLFHLQESRNQNCKYIYNTILFIYN